MKILKGIAFALLASILIIGCKKESEINETEQTKTENVIPADAKLETASLSIDGMTCEIGCAKTIESKLSSAPGVKEAKVDFEGKLATITFDANQQNVASLTKTIEGVAGGDIYKVTETKSVAN